MLNFNHKTGLVLTLGILAGVPGSLFAQPGFRKQLPTAPLVAPIQNNFPGVNVPAVNGSQGAATGYIVSGSNGTNIQTTSPASTPFNGSGISSLLGSPYNPSTLNGLQSSSGLNINNVPINTTGTSSTSSTSGLSSMSISNLPSNASALTPTGYPYTTLNTNSYPFTNSPYYNPYLANPATNPFAGGYLYPPSYVNNYYAPNPYAQPMYYNNPAFNNPLANPAYINQAMNALLNSNPFNSLLGINNPGNNNQPNNNFMNNPFNPFNNVNGVFGNMGNNANN